MQKSELWEFWIDVGGTFTDFLARAPNFSLRTAKLLSSGAIRGRVAEGSNRSVIRSSERCNDPPGFFNGYSFALLGQRPESVVVSHFDADVGELHLTSPLPFDPAPGIAYELTSGEEAPIVGVRWLLKKRLDEPIGAIVVRLGTTRGTNALLERQGAPTAFATTAGFGDVLRIGTQNRPKLFELAIRRPADLYRRVVELDERIDSRGRILRPLDVDAARAKLTEALVAGVTSLAVCLLNAHQNPAHELLVEKIAAEVGFEHASVSSRLSPSQRIVPRGETTVVDAYLTPILRDYVGSIREKLPEADVKWMTSSGGLVDAGHFFGRDSVLSGPAGGVVGVAYVARQAGFARAIGFDMGGTSTDVSRFDGEMERRYEMEIQDPATGATIRIVAPTLAIETVAAGGGSICDFDGQKATVGPRSGGSDPGPACYGRGGPLCVTDVNLYLGRILPEHFAVPLDRDAVDVRLADLAARIEQATGRLYSLEALAIGFVAIANANMAAAVKRISIAKGYDVRDYALISFGGAGGQHACALACELGIKTIVQHPYAGVLSAFGIGIADVSRFAERHVGRPLDSTPVEFLTALFQEMAGELREQIRAEGVSDDCIRPAIERLDLRYKGQDSTIAVTRGADGGFAAAFERMHRQRYGFLFPDRPIEVVAARLEMTGETEKPVVANQVAHPRRPTPQRIARVYFGEKWQDAPVFQRSDLHAGDVFQGPAIVVESNSTIIVEPSWRAEATVRGDLVLTDEALSNLPHRLVDVADEPDAIALELFNNRFAAIAEEMGETLRRTAISTNVKERLDFSCAVFTARGELVVNAPHIPVHLGAMGDTVRGLIADVEKMNAGDVYVTNDPYRGGSHLPDVTVITPVFAAEGGELLFFTGSRAHHAEIGGVAPGSMPPFSRTLAEEGVLIRAFRLVDQGKSREDELRRLLSSGPYPSRAVAENLADLNAQTAANRTGADRLLELIDQQGVATVLAYMGHIRRAAETKMRRALGRIPAAVYRFADGMDDGAPIVVAVTIAHDERGGSAVVDFTGSGPVSRGNQNANPAIVRSAVLYCFRCLLAEEIPLNDGVLAPVAIITPAGSILNPPAAEDPAECAAVVGGNVETSQRVVDVVLGALQLAAASQGTMNNFLFGRGADSAGGGFGYYETVAGGAGAGDGFVGASAVHTHMTNTRITDPEVLEARYPVRLRQFSIRRGSGGAGRFAGGDGVVREIEFLEPLTVSLLTNRRRTAPFGLQAGRSGESGRNLLFRAGAAEAEELPPAAQFEVTPGDVLRLETPGGGGFGRPRDD